YTYDADSGVLKKVPTSNGRPQYGPVVDETNGLLFFARGGLRCGKGVKFLELPVTTLGGSPTKVGELPKGFDLGFSASIALNTDTDTYDYFYNRLNCAKPGTADMYALRGVSPGP